MDTFLFPFEKVDKGSRIILYGFGVVGRHFFLQLERTNYCKVVFVADKKFETMNNFFVEVYSPERIKSYSKDEYDYIVIAIDDPDVSIIVKREFTQFGIDANKIITAYERHIGNWTFIEQFPKLSLDRIIEEEGFLKEYLRTFFLLNREIAWDSCGYYSDLYNLLSENRNNKNVLAIFKNILHDMDPVPEKLVLLRLLYDLEIFDANCMQMYMQTISDVDWIDDTPFVAIMDSSHMIHNGIAQKCIYPDFYNDRRNHLKKLCEYYNLKPGRMEKKNNEKRVAIISFSLNDESNDPADTLALRFAEDFVKEGYNVKIFVLNTLWQVGIQDSYLRKKFVCTGMKQSEFDGKKYKYEAFFAEKDRISDRLSEVIEEIFLYNPSFILDMSDEFCPQSYIYKQYFLTLYVPFRVGMSSSFFDYILFPDDGDFQEKNSIYKCIDKEQLLNARLYALPDEISIKYDRETYGFDKDDFIIVSVGVRLNYEVDDSIKMAMCELLKNNSHMKWVFVGDEVESSMDTFNELIVDGRIINHGYERYIDAFYGLCNVYLQPDRNGGAVSVTQAMRKGLPVIMLNRPSDSRKLFDEEDLCENIGEMIKRIEKLSFNQEYYMTVSEKMRESISKLKKKNNARRILDALNNVKRGKKNVN